MSTRGLRRAIPLITALLAISSCSAGQRSDSLVRVDVRLEGGLCQEGPCSEVLSIDGSGNWTFESGQNSKGSGKLDTADFNKLLKAAETSNMPVGTPSPGPCPPTAADGVAITYVVVLKSQERSGSSCNDSIPPDDPVVKELDQLLTKVRQ